MSVFFNPDVFETKLIKVNARTISTAAARIE